MNPPTGSITLWETLAQPWLCLHLPRFALFLFLALNVEVVASMKKVCPGCSIPTQTLLLVTGIFGILTNFFLVTHLYHPGDRLSIPMWYYPTAATFILGVTILFADGVRELLKDRRLANAITRCLLFAMALTFAISAARTPTRINRWLEEWENKAGNPAPDNLQPPEHA